MRQLCGHLMVGKGDKIERERSMGGSKPWHWHADCFIKSGRSCFGLSESRARHTKQRSPGMRQGGQLIFAGGGISSASTKDSESLF